MSQIFKSSASGPVPPQVPTSFVTDSGTAIPVANVLNVPGNTSTINNLHGIQTTGSGNTMTVQLTNRVQGSASTTGASTNALITLPLGATPGTYTIFVRVSGFEPTGPSSTSYFEYICAATNGTTARIVSSGDSDEVCLEDAALNASDVLITASANNLVISALGVTGLNVDWNADGLYTFVS